MEPSMQNPNASVHPPDLAHIPNFASLQEGGYAAMLAFPQYVVPTTAAYKTPSAIQSFQRVRDRFGFRTLFLEFLGSFFFVFLLIMPSAAFVLTGNLLGSYLVAITCLALAVTFAIYIGGAHSGAFLSPTVTITLAIFRQFPWKYVPFYIVSQFIGAFIAGVLSYALLAPWLDQFDLGNRMIVPIGPTNTISVFVSTPQLFIGPGHLFLNELLGCVIFMIILLAIVDSRNPLPNPQFAPWLIGFAVFLVAGVFGWYGFVLNPFRDFGPRVYLSAHYDNLFSYHNHYSMIALWTPFLGHILGALIYDLLINARYPVDPNASYRLDVSGAGRAKRAQSHGTLNHPAPDSTNVPIQAYPAVVNGQPVQQVPPIAV